LSYLVLLDRLQPYNKKRPQVCTRRPFKSNLKVSQEQQTQVHDITNSGSEPNLFLNRRHGVRSPPQAHALQCLKNSALSTFDFFDHGEQPAFALPGPRKIVAPIPKRGSKAMLQFDL
jgi:hypothetical protein